MNKDLFKFSEDSDTDTVNRINTILDVLKTSKTGKKILEFVNYTLEKRGKSVIISLFNIEEKRPRAYFSLPKTSEEPFEIGMNQSYSNEYLACGLAHELVHLIQYEYLDYMKTPSLTHDYLASFSSLTGALERAYANYVWVELAAYKITRIVSLEINLVENELETIEHGEDLINLINYEYRKQFFS